MNDLPLELHAEIMKDATLLEYLDYVEALGPSIRDEYLLKKKFMNDYGIPNRLIKFEVTIGDTSMTEDDDTSKYLLSLNFKYGEFHEMYLLVSFNDKQNLLLDIFTDTKLKLYDNIVYYVYDLKIKSDGPDFIALCHINDILNLVTSINFGNNNGTIYDENKWIYENLLIIPTDYLRTLLRNREKLNYNSAKRDVKIDIHFYEDRVIDEYNTEISIKIDLKLTFMFLSDTTKLLNITLIPLERMYYREDVNRFKDEEYVSQILFEALFDDLYGGDEYIVEENDVIYYISEDTDDIPNKILLCSSSEMNNILKIIQDTIIQLGYSRTSYLLEDMTNLITITN